MAIEYKCPICGCTEYYSIPTQGSVSERSLGTGFSDNPYTKEITYPRCLVEYELELSGDAWLTSSNFEFNATVRLCKKCGHIDLFNESMLEQIKRDEEEFSKQITIKEQEIKSKKN